MSAPADHQKVLIVDFGSQVTQLIARRLREASVYCEIHPYAKAEAALAAMKPQAIGLSVPGMPVGSPGMEYGDRRDAYKVLLIDRRGGERVFASYAGSSATGAGK